MGLARGFGVQFAYPLGFESAAVASAPTLPVFLGTLGGGTAAGTTPVTFTVKENVAIGDTVFLASRAGPQLAHVASVADSAGNTWGLVVRVTGTATISPTVEIWRSKITTALVGGTSTITVDKSASSTFLVVAASYSGTATVPLATQTSKKITTTTANTITMTSTRAVSLWITASSTSGTASLTPGTVRAAFVPIHGTASVAIGDYTTTVATNILHWACLLNTRWGTVLASYLG